MVGGVSRWPLATVLALLLASASMHCSRDRVGQAQEEEALSPDLRRGQRSFAMRCAGCHTRDSERVGPSMREIGAIHASDPDAIVRWAKTPGRKRTDKPAMPSFRHLTDDDLYDIARYILWSTAPDAGPR